MCALVGAHLVLSPSISSPRAHRADFDLAPALALALALAPHSIWYSCASPQRAHSGHPCVFSHLDASPGLALLHRPSCSPSTSTSPSPSIVQRDRQAARQPTWAPARSPLLVYDNLNPTTPLPSKATLCPAFFPAISPSLSHDLLSHFRALPPDQRSPRRLADHLVPRSICL